MQFDREVAQWQSNLVLPFVPFVPLVGRIPYYAGISVVADSVADSSEDENDNKPDT